MNVIAPGAPVRVLVGVYRGKEGRVVAQTGWELWSVRLEGFERPKLFSEFEFEVVRWPS